MLLLKSEAQFLSPKKRRSLFNMAWYKSNFQFSDFVIIFFTFLKHKILRSVDFLFMTLYQTQEFYKMSLVKVNSPFVVTFRQRWKLMSFFFFNILSMPYPDFYSKQNLHIVNSLNSLEGSGWKPLNQQVWMQRFLPFTC